MGIKNIKECKLNNDDIINLISLRTVDGNAPYLVFDNVIVSAFLDDRSIYSGGIVLSKCINHTLIFALSYGPPYIKGCLITGLSNDTAENRKPEGFCFAEKNMPESVWFGKDQTLIVIKNDNNSGEWNGKYIIYNNHEEDAKAFNQLPDINGYKIYQLGMGR
ncbi:TPA: hypothetical protein OW286_005665 [Citrobacter freundii]|nr:hypothetical protein [Citrobacter freundii]